MSNRKSRNETGRFNNVPSSFSFQARVAVETKWLSKHSPKTSWASIRLSEETSETVEEPSHSDITKLTNLPPWLKPTARARGDWHEVNHFLCGLSDVITFDQIGIIHTRTQLLREENIFPMMPRSEWLAQWSLRYIQKCSKNWVKNSQQNFRPCHYTPGYSMVKIACLEDAFLDVF